MKTTLVILLLYGAVLLVVIAEEEEGTRDLPTAVEDPEELERKHRKRKKHGQNSSPCGFGGYGKTFGSHDTYISAPVMNYFLCGVAPYPVQGGYGHGGGHGGHGSHGGQGGHGGHGGHGGQGGHGGHGYGGQGGYGQQGGYGGFGGPGFGGPGYYGGQGLYNRPGFNQIYPGQFNRPFQNVVSAAASGLGNVLSDYLTRPRKTQKQINQLLRPIYKLF